MGISLFGLTPAATYPSLIKFGDNSAISGTLRALSDGLGTDLPIQVSTAGVNFTGTASIGGTAIITNSSGVSGAIQFSNGSAFASDATNFFWDNTNKRLGVGTNAPTYPISVGGVGTNGSISFHRSSDAALQGYIGTLGTGVTLNGGTSYIYMGTTNTNAIGTSILTTLGAMWGIRGSGTTSATTSLLVQNSAGTQLLKVADDGRLTIGVNATFFGDTGNFISNYSGGVTALIIASQGSSSKTLQLRGGSGSADIQTWETSGGGSTLGVFTSDGKLGVGTNAPTTALDISAPLTSIINLRNGGTNFITTRTSGIGESDIGLRIWNNANNTTLDLYGSGSYDSAKHRFCVGGGSFERLLIGLTTAAKITGSGSTSATTSLLVQNSAGNDTMKVWDSRQITLGGASLYSGYQLYGNATWGCTADIQSNSSLLGDRLGIGASGGVTIVASAQAQIDSTTRGFLPPRMTTAQKNAIGTPAAGLMVYDTTVNKLFVHNGTVWEQIQSI